MRRWRQDGRIVFARHRARTGRWRCGSARPAGRSGGRCTIAPRGGDTCTCWSGADGTAGVLFDEGDVRYAALRPPGGDVAAARSRSGRPSADEAIAPSGELWRVGPAPGLGRPARRLPAVRLDPAAGAACRGERRHAGPDHAGAGGARVVYVEEGTTSDQGRCLGKTVVLAIDVSGAGEVGAARDARHLQGQRHEHGDGVRVRRR